MLWCVLQAGVVGLTSVMTLKGMEKSGMMAGNRSAAEDDTNTNTELELELGLQQLGL